jgi:hypothetical protein
MKPALSFIAIFLFVAVSCAQSRTIGKEEYETAVQYAVSKTNKEYPHIFKVKTSFIKDGRSVRTETEVNENEAAGLYRIKRTVLADGRETSKYQLTVGFGNIFCSDDGANWKPSKYECPAQRRIYGNQAAESAEYSVTEKTVDGKDVRVYREYSVFAPSEGSKQKTFTEKIATITLSGYFINIIATEGTLAPKAVTLIREQSWVTQAKIEPIVAPK